MKSHKRGRRNAFALDNVYPTKAEEESNLADDKRTSQSVTDVETTSQEAGNPLTKDLVNAFREVFDLFDSNGGGTIDAEELDIALRSVDIQLSQEEIIDVLTTMDRDGNGEIDFDEFLNLMTNTERFLEGIGDNLEDNTEKYRRRETMLFEALTNFMKKSALHSIDEIVGFYHTKYKRAQAPHVVGHYAAGARLIGLTEFQLRKHMETLRNAKRAAGHENSPYAESLHVVFGNVSKRKKKALPRRGRIRLRFNTTCYNTDGFSQDQPIPLKKDQVTVKHRPSLPVSISLLPHRRFDVPVTRRLPKVPKNQGTGWKSQRIQPFPVELPVNCGKMSNIPGKLNSKVLTFDYLPAIKEKVGKAKEDFSARLYYRKRKESEQHWQALQSGCIHSDALRNKFRIAFNAYTQFLQVNDSDPQRESRATSTRVQRRSKSVEERKISKPQHCNEKRAKSTF